MPNATNENMNGVSGNTTTGDNAPGKSTRGSNPDVNTIANTRVRSQTVTKKTIVEMCGLSMDKNH